MEQEEITCRTGVFHVERLWEDWELPLRNSDLDFVDYVQRDLHEMLYERIGRSVNDGRDYRVKVETLDLRMREDRLQYLRGNEGASLRPRILIRATISLTNWRDAQIGEHVLPEEAPAPGSRQSRGFQIEPILFVKEKQLARRVI